MSSDIQTRGWDSQTESGTWHGTRRKNWCKQTSIVIDAGDLRR